MNFLIKKPNISLTLANRCLSSSIDKHQHFFTPSFVQRHSQGFHFDHSFTLVLLDFQFVASPNCQFVLDGVIYKQSPGWRNRGIGIKAAWCLLQLLLVSLTIPFYIPLKLIRKNFPCCGFDSHWLRKLYEDPYSKFLNHTMSYMIFLALIFGSSFEYTYGPDGAGLTWIGELIFILIIT